MGGLFLLITWRLWFGFSFIISRRSYKETFFRGPHNVNKFEWGGRVFWSCSVWKGICNFYNKIDDVFTEVSVIVRGDKIIFWLCQLLLSEQNVIWVSEMDTRWRASNKLQGFLIVPDLRSCGMLSTLPLFYIVQSVDSDDRRARFQGLRAIMMRLKIKITTVCRLIQLPPLTLQSILSWKILDLAPM